MVDMCAAEDRAPALGQSACVLLADGARTPVRLRRFALERVCHSSSPGDSCGRLKDLALPTTIASNATRER
jgi:hypothetical protein